MNKNITIITVALIFTAIIIGVGCYVKLHQKNNGEIIDDSPAINTMQGISTSTMTGVQSEKTGWLSLADSFYEFSFLYPKNWSVSKYVDNNYDSRIDAGQKAYTYWLFDENGNKVAIIFNEGQYGHGWPEETDPVRNEFIGDLGRAVAMEGHEHVSYIFSEFPNFENNLRVECTTSSQEVRNSVSEVVKSFAIESSAFALDKCQRFGEVYQLSEDVRGLKNSTDIVKYIVDNNLYVIACDRLWHGDRNLLASSSITEYVKAKNVNPSARYREEGFNEGFRYESGKYLYIFFYLITDSEWTETGYYFVINKDTDAVQIIYDKNANLWPYVKSPDNTKLLYVNKDNGDLYAYDWLNRGTKKLLTINDDETFSCGEYGEFINIPTIIQWVNDGDLELKVYKKTDVVGAEICQDLSREVNLSIK
ncbi:MAG: hypothetical protein WC457_00865 [Patescibacteria group bacterium]